MIDEIDENGLLQTPTPEDMMGSGMFANKNEGLNHELLVMNSYNKCINALSREMKEGFNKLITGSNGEKVIEKEDTRQTAMECVETLKNVTIADLEGTEQAKEIRKLYTTMEESDKRHLQNQKNWWDSLRPSEREAQQIPKGTRIDNIYFCSTLQFYKQAIIDKIKIYRQIFEQIEKGLAVKKYNKKKRAGGTIKIDTEDGPN